MCGFREVLHQHGVRLNVLGRTEMLPGGVQKSIRIAQEMTKNNNKWPFHISRLFPSNPNEFHRRGIFNLCMPYTGRDEIATAVQFAAQENVAGGLEDAERLFVPLFPRLSSHVDHRVH